MVSYTIGKISTCLGCEKRGGNMAWNRLQGRLISTTQRLCHGGIRNSIAPFGHYIIEEVKERTNGRGIDTVAVFGVVGAAYRSAPPLGNLRRIVVAAGLSAGGVIFRYSAPEMEDERSLNWNSC
ncbi:hypothetical protein EJ08DRAFT_8054 [Tothia fuscella]|uniref:Uncharacterized protein n=1 Tax=Tothia fuscella TaxID=1048955 RepID=A0A9P4P580_9PEZI|nr:hypothetical protein EJ08DRAFT_8054 [Tothia fuscella]